MTATVGTSPTTGPSFDSEEGADLPSGCPYCDSNEVSYTYVRHLDPRRPVRLVFTCDTCGSHVESDATGTDLPVGDRRWTVVQDQIPGKQTEYNDMRRL